MPDAGEFVDRGERVGHGVLDETFGNSPSTIRGAEPDHGGDTVAAVGAPVTVEEYVARIGLEGPPEPTRAWLTKAHEAHLATVPFENLDIHLDTVITLDEEHLLDKVVRRHRGGFCYELNGTFGWLLRRVGFRVDLLEARVPLDEERFSAAFDHAVLRVWLDGEPWQADVGFGDHAGRPFPMADGATYEEIGRTWRWAAREPGFLDLDHRRRDGDWFVDHRTSLVPHELADFSERCTWQQTSPDSHFTHGPVCTIARPGGGRFTLADDLLIIVEPDGSREHVSVETDDEILATYRERFGVDLPRRPRPKR
jgi:N-hydroxyarylamine O-acetyltransferase